MENHLELLLQNKHTNPHAFLGLHENIIRVFRPEKDEIYLEVKNTKLKATKIDLRGLFEYKLDNKITIFDYKIYFSDNSLKYDPYSFETILDEVDIDKFLNGRHSELYKILGAHKKKVQGMEGIQFSIWAPNANGVSVIGDFNNWNGYINPLKNVEKSGIWQIFIPSLEYGKLYKYEITTKDEKILVKTDPFAYYTELRPHNSAFTFDIDEYKWNDEKWLEKRKNQNSCKAY